MHLDPTDLEAWRIELGEHIANMGPYIQRLKQTDKRVEKEKRLSRMLRVEKGVCHLLGVEPHRPLTRRAKEMIRREERLRSRPAEPWMHREALVLNAVLDAPRSMRDLMDIGDCSYSGALKLRKRLELVVDSVGPNNTKLYGPPAWMVD